MRSVTPHKLFLDTNVWFSAFHGSANCTKLLKAHTQGIFIAVISQQVIEEAVKNIREKMPVLLPRFEQFMMENPPQVVTNPGKINSKIVKLVDRKDQSLFTAAISDKVDFFVTGNIKDFSVEKLEAKTGIKTITPREAVELLHL